MLFFFMNELKIEINILLEKEKGEMEIGTRNQKPEYQRFKIKKVSIFRIPFHKN